MQLYQAILIALMTYLSSECVPWLMGDFGGYYVLSKPLASGLIVGFIMNNIPMGITIGAAVQTLYLASMSVGGAIQTDIAVVAYPAVALGVIAGDSNVAIALATTFGILGILVWNTMQFFNVLWGNFAYKEAEKGNYAGIVKYHVGGAQLTTFLLRFVPTFLVCYYGADYISNISNFAPEWLMHALGVAGGILPAVGITMLTSLLIKELSDWAYLMIGFVMVVYFQFDLIAVAVIAVIITVLSYKNNQLKEPASNQKRAEENSDMEVEF